MKSLSYCVRVLGVLLLAVLMIGMLATPMAAQRTYRDATSGFLNQTTFVPLAAYTASGNSGSASVDMGPYSAGVIHVDVTAISGTGTPTLTVNFQACADATTTYCTTHTASAAITATGNYLIKVNNFGRYVFVTYTISGTTPSFTFQALGAFKPTT